MPSYRFLDHPGPIPFAHRGGAHEAPENTAASFEYAVGLGYRYLETDVHVTADGVVVVIHDPTLDRVSDRTGKVTDLTWPQVAAARLTSDARVPRLDELLGTWPDVRWNIDAKHDAVVDPLVEVIRSTGALERVCVTSFSDRRLARIRAALGPRLCTGMGPVGITRLRVASLTPGAGSAGGAGGAGGARGLGAAVLAGSHGVGAAQIPLRQGLVPIADRRFVDVAHRLGVAVHVWTIDDASTMEWLLDLGVDGIMTDRPSRLKEVLLRRGQWVEPGPAG